MIWRNTSVYSRAMEDLKFQPASLAALFSMFPAESRLPPGVGNR